MKLNRTLTRAIEIMELLSKNKNGYTLVEIVDMLKAPKSSVFDILKTLVHKNMIEEDNSFGRTKYKIGLNSFLIGSSYLNSIDLVNIAKQYLVPLANKIGATTFMAVMDDYMVTYIYKYESADSVITTANLGTRRQIHSSSLGKAMLAFSSEKEISEAIKKIDFEAYTEFTITSVEKFIDELRKIRRLGYSKDDRENSLHQVCVGAPVFNHLGKVVAAVSCVGLYEKMNNVDQIGEMVKEEASKISNALGYFG